MPASMSSSVATAGTTAAAAAPAARDVRYADDETEDAHAAAVAALSAMATAFTIPVAAVTSAASAAAADNKAVTLPAAADTAATAATTASKVKINKVKKIKKGDRPGNDGSRNGGQDKNGATSVRGSIVVVGSNSSTIKSSNNIPGKDTSLSSSSNHHRPPSSASVSSVISLSSSATAASANKPPVSGVTKTNKIKVTGKPKVKAKVTLKTKTKVKTTASSSSSTPPAAATAVAPPLHAATPTHVVQSASNVARSTTTAGTNIVATTTAAPTATVPATPTAIVGDDNGGGGGGMDIDWDFIFTRPHTWLKHNEHLFSSVLKEDTVTGPDGTTTVPKPYDVLCGRGGETNHHPGNVRYRNLVKSYQRLYVDAPRRDKPKIAQCIVFTVRISGGRFLKRDVLGTDETGTTVTGKDKVTPDTPSSRSWTKVLPPSSSASPSTSTSSATAPSSSPSPSTSAWYHGAPTKEDVSGANASRGLLWVDVGNNKAREKTSQALREGAPELRNNGGLTGSNFAGHSTETHTVHNSIISVGGNHNSIDTAATTVQPALSSSNNVMNAAAAGTGVDVDVAAGTGDATMVRRTCTRDEPSTNGHPNSMTEAANAAAAAPRYQGHNHLHPAHPNNVYPHLAMSHAELIAGGGGAVNGRGVLNGHHPHQLLPYGQHGQQSPHLHPHSSHHPAAALWSLGFPHPLHPHQHPYQISSRPSMNTYTNPHTAYQNNANISTAAATAVSDFDPCTSEKGTRATDTTANTSNVVPSSSGTAEGQKNATELKNNGLFTGAAGTTIIPGNGDRPMSSVASVAAVLLQNPLFHRLSSDQQEQILVEEIHAAASRFRYEQQQLQQAQQDQGSGDPAQLSATLITTTTTTTTTNPAADALMALKVDNDPASVVAISEMPSVTTSGQKRTASTLVADSPVAITSSTQRIVTLGDATDDMRSVPEVPHSSTPSSSPSSPSSSSSPRKGGPRLKRFKMRVNED